ncbi:hypothetical protein ACFP3U_01365 [Kitasatospora misakiensis]|uniref:Uncharacterized protein n=1 Tax=Kitasatospora misakiensis TaxID=67330 RepID=A0ABW0WVE6_9ACTN
MAGRSEFSIPAPSPRPPAANPATGEPDGLNEALDASPEADPLRAVVKPAGTRWDVADDDEMRRRLPRLAGILRPW